jgi:two-component system CheB/CheR fusion protein
VDVTAAPEKIPGLLSRYARSPLRSQWEEEEERPANESSLEQIFSLLQQRHKIDFSYYKPTTIGRRIERRIQLNHHGDLDQCVECLINDPSEVDQLYKDLLIGVTRFFRDPDAFSVLKQKVLSRLLAQAPLSEEFRVWVAGCGTGEEAYSVAILIDECMRETNRQANVKIFATDVHQASLDFAHAGVYPEAGVREMSDERRSYYFKITEAGFQVLPRIRKMIVFAPHNVIKDAPFTHLQLITCRNLLIYLRSMVQKKVVSLFHFGLNTGGVLFMGASETPGELAGEFDTVDEHSKLYRKRRDVRLSASMRGTFGHPNFRETVNVSATKPFIASDSELIATYDELLARHMPPGVLVNEQREVIHMFGGVGKYLSLADGRPTSNLLELVSGDLKLTLTGALQRVTKSGEAVSYKRVRVQSDSGEKFVQLDVSPLRKRGSGMKYVFTFQELDTPDNQAEPESMDLDEVSRNQILDLEQELRYTKENLQATVEELETSNEELQATNEELVASNEELQSTNEELQSVNEELYTVNAEYQKKIQELTEATADMDNLLQSTQVHTLFLDKHLCIRKFTPDMAPVFNLIPQDIGRRIEGFTHHVVCDGLLDKLTAVLNSGTAYEEEVRDSDDVDYLMRILPYAAIDEIEGVVLTLIDVSARKQMQRGLDVERAKYEASLREEVARRDNFLAMLSHELRNPMGAVLSAINATLREDGRLDERHSLIQRQTRHMARLLDDLLDLARIQQNKIEFRKDPVDLIPMTEEVLEGVRHQFQAKDQVLHVTMGDSPLTVFADAARLRQAQVNLLTNASKYTPARGEIWYEVASTAEEAVITVRDSGEGIAAELLSDIFEPFVQSDSSLARSSGGMGVGLSLARSIVEAHDGSIVAESAGLGMGSTFRIRLPRTSKPLPPIVPAPHFSFQGRKLLLVEDNDDARQMLAKTLRLSGFEVADTGDGQAALELFRSFQPDVAVIDIGLPVMDGYQLAKGIRKMDGSSEPMLIALTGYGRHSDRQAAMDAGFDAHLVKPLDPAELYAQIATKYAASDAT